MNKRGEAGHHTVHRELLDLIERFGWAVRHVGAGTEAGEAPLSYTVGLTRFGHPELVCQGLPFDVAQSFLNLIGTEVQDGRIFRPDTFVTDLTDGGTLAFIHVVNDTGKPGAGQSLRTRRGDSLRHAGQLYSIGLGQHHNGQTVLMLVHDLDITISNATTGQILRQLTLNPTTATNPKTADSPNPEGSGSPPCLETSHLWVVPESR